MRVLEKEDILNDIRRSNPSDNDVINRIWNYVFTSKYINMKRISVINETISEEDLKNVDDINMKDFVDIILDDQIVDIVDFNQRNCKMIPKIVSTSFYKDITYKNKKEFYYYDLFVLPYILNYAGTCRDDNRFNLIIRYYEEILYYKLSQRNPEIQNILNKYINLEMLIFYKFNNPELIYKYVKLKQHCTPLQMKRWEEIIDNLSDNDVDVLKYNKHISEIKRMLYSKERNEKHEKN